MLRIAVVMALAGLLMAGQVGAETPDLEPGEWRMQNRITFEGGPPMPEQNQENTECLTREQIEEGPDQLLEDPEGNCEVTELEQDASSMRYTMSCAMEGGEDMTMDGEMKFLGDRMEGGYTGEMSAGGETMRMKMEVTGERVGDC